MRKSKTKFFKKGGIVDIARQKAQDAATIFRRNKYYDEPSMYEMSTVWIGQKLLELTDEVKLEKLGYKQFTEEQKGGRILFIWSAPASVYLANVIIEEKEYRLKKEWST